MQLHIGHNDTESRRKNTSYAVDYADVIHWTGDFSSGRIYFVSVFDQVVVRW